MKSNVSDIENLARSFATVFAGRKDARGTLQGGCVREPLKLSHIINHVQGNQSLGRYPLLDNGTCKWAVVDFDFKSDPNRVELAEKAARRFAKKLFELGLKSYWFERTKSGLIHLWLFFSEPIEARKIRRILQFVARELNLKISNGVVEIFPKQDELSDGQIGNYIHLPYFHGSNGHPLDKRVMLDPHTFAPISLETFLDRVNQSLISPLEIDVVFDSLTKEDSQSEETSNQRSKSSESAGQIKKEKIIEVFRDYWTEGQRQDLSMCLAGFLAKQRIPWPEAANLILEIAALVGDSETRQRIAALKATYKKAQKGQVVKGYKGLEEILSSEDLRILTSLFDSPRVQVVEADEEIEGEKSIKKLDLDFPEKAYETGIFKLYVESFKYSETPPQFYFSTLASYLGLRLGRDVYTYYPRPVYPNLYICNVAPTGNKKSTGGYLYDLSKDIPQNEFQIISGISSPEGLVRLFTEEVKKNERIAIPEKQILIIQNELTTIFKKGERQVTSTLLEYLNDFYDYLPYIDVPTKQNPLRAERPCLGILSSTTLGAFEKILTEHHVRMGFLNRFCFFIGEVSEPVANPSMPNKDVMDLIGKELNKILKFAKKLREKSKNEIELSEGAKELWQSYYNDLFHEKDNLSELEIEIAERTHVFARKFAVLYAIAKESCIVKEDDDINRAPLIDEDDLYRACLIADYLKSSARYLITKLGETKYTRLEERLLKYLKENRGRAFSISTLRKVAGGYYSRFEVLTALKNLSYEGVKIVQQKGITYYGFF